MATATTPLELKRLMPLLARHEGVWEGWYRYYNAAGEREDQHRSRLLCRFPASGPYPYHQTNFYRWEDGRSETRDFPATVKDGRIFWDNDLITGWAADVPLDDFKRTTMLNWVRKGDPDTYLYEMIQISDCGRYRHRVWHWYRKGRLIQRTLIDEERVADDWAKFERENPTF